MNPDVLRILRFGYLAILFLGVAALGSVYAVHNTDSHHWGFILGASLDFIAGRDLFTEVYMQYGAAQPLLHKAMNYFVPLTYTNIGLLTAVAYAASLVVIFLCVERLASTHHAVLLTILAFLHHPYAVFPWPDYFAGFCLILACYCLLPAAESDTTKRDVLAGLLLFLAFLFRNTYVVNLVGASGLYFVAAIAFPKLKDQRIMRACAVFLLATAAYFLLLSLQHKLMFWYQQNLGAAPTAYGIGATTGVVLLDRMFSPYSMLTFAFSIAIWINIFNLVMVFRRVRSDGIDSPVTSPFILFFGLLGLTGVIQGLQFYEPYRLQSACSPLYLGVACFLAWRPTGHTTDLRPASGWVLATIIVGLALSAPSLFNGRNHSTIWPLIEKPRDFFYRPLEGEASRKAVYSWSTDIPVFQGHRFVPDVQNYYASLANVLCPSSKKIVNFTGDSMVPYICGSERNSLHTASFGPLLKRIAPAEFDRIDRGDYALDELIISDGLPVEAPDTVLVRVATVARPYQIRWLPINQSVNIYGVKKLVHPREPAASARRNSDTAGTGASGSTSQSPVSSFGT